MIITTNVKPQLQIDKQNKPKINSNSKKRSPQINRSKIKFKRGDRF